MKRRDEQERRRSLRRVTMLLENDLFPQDTRVRGEATSLSRAGYAVHVIAPRGEGQPAREVIDGVSVERFRLPMSHSGRIPTLVLEYVIAHLQLYVRGLRAILRGANVLHVHNPPDTLFVPGLLGRLTGCKLVFDQHDLFPELFSAKFGDSRLRFIPRAAQRLSLRLADLVITTNESQRRAALKHVRAGQDRVIVVRNGPPAAELQHATAGREGPLRDPHLVYVGALEAQDGVDHLPELLAVLLADHGVPDPRMTVVGWGTRLPHLQAEARALGLDDRIHFTGRVEHRKALDVIADADVCLDVAPCNELNHASTMVKIVEYLVLGKPAVSFALRETKSTAGDAVLYAPCGDWQRYAELVAELIDSQARRDELRARALSVAPSLVWERSERALLEAYAAW